MVILDLNRPEYLNDLSEEIRMFTGISEIRLAEEDQLGDAEMTLCVRLSEEAGGWIASAEAEGRCVRLKADLPQTDPLEAKRQEKRALKSAAFRLLRELYPKVSVPWGSLTGIRPTKLYRDLTDRSGHEEADRLFREFFDVSEEKRALAKTICDVQVPVIRSMDPAVDMDVYIGIPFCRTRCLYCSFASEVVGKNDHLSQYFDALLEDVKNGGELVSSAGKRVRAIYIGGGTPTVLSEEQLKVLLDTVEETYGTGPYEYTVEAGRPDTITAGKLQCMREHGVQRVSVNPQTMNDETLARIGRSHSAEEIVKAYELVRSFGFDSVNMDLIAGLPGESLEDFVRSMDAVCLMKPDNITIHSLALKRSSELKRYLDRYPLPPAEVTESMLNYGAKAAAALGMVPYYMYRQKYMSGNLENTGYALPDKLCIYNIDMMEETGSILAHGGSAISKFVFPDQNRVERVANPKEVRVYIEKLPKLLEEKRAMLFTRA